MKIPLPVIIILAFVSFSARAQQRPQYTQYVYNNFLLNPALSGIENYVDLKLGYRKQWSGITNAPQTSFVTANWNLGSDYLWKNALSLPDRGDDPMSRNYMQNYTSSPSHHGMGIVAVLDKTGPLSRLDANVTYAYHLQLNDALNLSVGAAVGLTRIALDVNALLLENPNDPALYNTTISQVKPDVGLGVWLYGARFFAGISAQQLIPQNLSFTSDPNYTSGKEVAHYFITAGYKIFLDDEIAAIPSIMVKQVSPVPLSVDANLKLTFKDRFWVGGSYRRGDSYAAIIGVNMSKLLNLTYSYDFTTSELNKVTNGSHEIVLGLQLNNVYEVLSTQKMW